MEYLLLEYQNADGQSEWSDSERRHILEACRDNNHALRESGYLTLAATVQGSAVSVSNGIVSVSDTESSVSGIYIIHANDMNDAIRTVCSMPQTRLTTIEIRPLIRTEA